MSNTYNICCDDCKIVMWFGQSSNHENIAYRGNNKEPLVEFLLEHAGHRLHSFSDYAGDMSETDSSAYAEVSYRDYFKDKGTSTC